MPAKVRLPILRLSSSFFEFSIYYQIFKLGKIYMQIIKSVLLMRL